ncbi:MAG: DUF2207 domain-containing protein, partial [Actinobacteria bacterium]|nr:DUF2207 domain-containing protein [Actinomycetota bacterium]
MKRIFKLLLTVLTTLVLLPLSAKADVNDFSFESFDAQYEISLNEEQDNRPEMIVTETLVALFPDFNQNRGIRRDIPASSYGELPGLVKIISVTDESGNPREYEETRDGNLVSLAIKASDGSFVLGRQTYVIKYSQAWVIKDYKRISGFDEFYWDVNGTGWQQSFGKVTASVSLDSKLQAALASENVSCYQGEFGSNATCDSKEILADKVIFSSSNLQAGENLTIALPFAAGVANTKGPEVAGTIPMILFWIALALVIVILLWAIYFRFFVIRRQGRKPFIVPIYQPTKEPGLLTSVVGPSAKDKQLQKIAERIEELVSAERKVVNKSGYFIKRALGLPAVVFVAGIAIFAIWLVAGLMLDSVTEAGFVAAPVVLFGPFAILYWLLVSKRAYSAKGGEVLATVSGLEMYIELAEKDRLEFLQSPQGASLKPSELKGKQVLKLYEEILPWAILLGLQKQWSKVLTDLYAQGAVPLWIVGVPQLSDSLDSLDSAVATSLASSSTGGS